MAELMNRLKCWVKRVSDGRENVRRTLERAVANGNRAIELKSIDPRGEKKPITMSTTVLSVGIDAFTITRPMVGQRVRQLRRNEHLQLVLSADPDNPHMLVGECRALGRTALRDDRGGKVLGYRISLPQEFQKLETKKSPRRTAIAFDDNGEAGLAVEVELRSLSHQTAIHGVLLNLSRLKARIRSHNARGKLEEGQRLHAHLELPSPIGDRVELVEIERFDEQADTSLTIINLRFVKPLEGIEKLLDATRPAA